MLRFLSFFFYYHYSPLDSLSFPTRRSSDLCFIICQLEAVMLRFDLPRVWSRVTRFEALVNSAVCVASLLVTPWLRSEEHTSELQSRGHLVCRLLLEKKKTYQIQGK